MTTSTLRPYRPIPFLHGACTVCDEVHPLTDRHKQPAVCNKYGVTHKRFLLPVHGPRNARCPGGHTEPTPWLEAAGLPDWKAMSDLDKGAALMHGHKRRREGSGYAEEHYPVGYYDHPVLLALDTKEACRHAAVVAGRVWDEIPDVEFRRLYDLALNHKPA